MKVVAVNGSPHKDGNTAEALAMMADVLREDDIETELIHPGIEKINGCIGCFYCQNSENHMCVFKDDLVDEASRKMRAADGLILGAPTYYSGIPGGMKSFLDRVFFSGSRYLKYKAGTAVSIARRAGGVDVVHQLMNFFNLSETITPPSQYWVIAYGMNKGEALKDLEGVQTIKKNARALAWLLKIIDATKDTIPRPEAEKRVFTNFIR
ncbi:MAG: flavodoxin family protein [Synergistaceae bacterium]|jgi:multimeric flavodoxin WrbA|nr:flavodoxin family protein [Synergistaceae bacterium]